MPARKPGGLSDFLIEVVEQNPKVRAILLQLHAADVETLSTSVLAKLPRHAKGPKTTTWVVPTADGSINCYGDKAAALAARAKAAWPICPHRIIGSLGGAWCGCMNGPQPVMWTPPRLGVSTI